MTRSILAEANELVRQGCYEKAKALYLSLKEFEQAKFSVQMSIDYCERKLSNQYRLTRSGSELGGAKECVSLISNDDSFDVPKFNNISLFRILGNSIDGLHAEDQYLKNLEFQLKNEVCSEKVNKIWILNRIIDRRGRGRIIECLSDYSAKYFEIEFNREIFDSIANEVPTLEPGVTEGSYSFRLRYLQMCANKLNSYVMNNNGARNFALVVGRLCSDWILPFDGNVYINQKNFSIMLERFSLSRGDEKIYTCPMARVFENDVQKIESLQSATEEPQLLFGCLSAGLFDERFVYGRRPKVEMLWRLGVPGVWDKFSDDAYDPLRNSVNLDDFYGGPAFSVVRLSTGGDVQSVNNSNRRNSIRSEGVVRFFSRLSSSYRSVVEIVCPELLV